MRTLLLLTTASLLALGTGCSTWNATYYPRTDPPPSAAPEPSADGEAPAPERLTLSAGGFTFRDVRLEGSRVWGSMYEVAHFDDGYRGSSPYGFLYLSEKVPGQVSGVTGNGALTNLAYETDATTGELRATGRWAWKQVDLVATRDTITVTRRFCTDTYKRVENTDAFVGRPKCWQAGPLGATLHVPDAFFERPAGEQIVFLTMFLA
jgi:hypothetical protein